MPKRHVWIALLCLLPTLASAEYCPDLDGDNQVSGTDFLAFQRSFNTRAGHEGYIYRADANQDGYVSGWDYLRFMALLSVRRVCSRMVWWGSAEAWRQHYGYAVVYIEWYLDGVKYTRDDWPSDTCERFLFARPVYLIALDSSGAEVHREELQMHQAGDPLPPNCEP